MKHAASRDLHAYWDRLRCGRSAPERGDIDPVAIRHILAYTFILDVDEATVPSRGRDVRFRLSGTRLNALFGRDLGGSAFESLWTRRDVPAVESMLDGVLDDRAATVASARGGPPDAGPLDLELLLLPLRHHGRTHARLLGSLAAEGVPGWMGLSPSGPLDLMGFRSLDDGGSARPATRRDAKTPIRRRFEAVRVDHAPPAPSVPLRVGRFRVYQGGRSGAPEEPAR